jgi:hypothetical protein
MHRMFLDAPLDMEVDHRDRNGLNNQRANLRLATHSQNQANRRMFKCTVSGIKGVSPKGKKWRAQIRFDGNLIRLGTFEDKMFAGQVYKAAAEILHGEFAYSNV